MVAALTVPARILRRGDQPRSEAVGLVHWMEIFVTVAIVNYLAMPIVRNDRCIYMLVRCETHNFDRLMETVAH